MRRSAFTLVEMLMVILIISMLIALLLPAVNAARVRALEASVIMQMNELNTGIETFRAEHSTYPPDRHWTMPTNSPPDVPDGELVTCLRRMWPRAIFSHQDLNILYSMDQSEILVFWLGGIWDGTRFTGFSGDPRNPLAGPDAQHDPFGRGVVSKRTMPFQFDVTKILDRDNDGFPEYYPMKTQLDQAPLVYFSARPTVTYLDSQGSMPFYSQPGIGGIAVPYQKYDPSRVRFWKEDSYQMVWAGIDNDFGTAVNYKKVFPEVLGQGDNDNVVSFLGKRIGDAQR